MATTTKTSAAKAERRGPAVEEQLCFALYAAQLAMARLYREVLSDLGLTYPQYLVLLVLWERDARRVSDIGARLYLDSATLTPLLKRLERGGLVTRARDADDERAVRIALTPAGRALRRHARAVSRCVASAAAGPRGAAGTRPLVRGLNQLRTRLDTPARA